MSLTELVDVPAGGPVAYDPDTWGACDVRWTAHKGSRRLCDGCTAAIHRLGAAVAPYPRAAAWKRSGPNGLTWLCVPHADVQEYLDRRAEALRSARLMIVARARSLGAGNRADVAISGRRVV